MRQRSTIFFFFAFSGFFSRKILSPQSSHFSSQAKILKEAIKYIDSLHRQLVESVNNSVVSDANPAALISGTNAAICKNAIKRKEL